MPGKGAPNVDVRQFIERGLERYRRGELPGAIAEWDKVLAVDPENVEATNLIAFVRGMMPPAPGDEDKDPWPLGEKTTPESQEETAQRVQRAESEVMSEVMAAPAKESTRRPKMTIESPISGFLAPITSPAWKPPTTGTHKAVTDTQRNVAAQPGGDPASEMVNRCRSESEKKKWEAAAVAADAALSLADGPSLAKVADDAQDLFEKAFTAHIGKLQKIPVLTASAVSDKVMALGAPRQVVLMVLAAFDGIATVEEILLALPNRPPVSRLECLRVFSGLLRAKAIKLT